VLRGRDLLSIGDLTSGELRAVLDAAHGLKAGLRGGVGPSTGSPGRAGPPQRAAQGEREARGRAEGRPYGGAGALAGRVLALVFEKPSLRTRVSFDVGMRQLGGECVYVSPQEVGLGTREPVEDVARVLSRYVDCIAARTFAHETVVELARWSEAPVINALSEGEHPCQALADLMTVEERFGRLEGVRLAYVGDGNNVARSLWLGCAMTGVELRIASPEGYELPEGYVSKGEELASNGGGGRIVMTREPKEAVEGADVVYTDVWMSMGQEEESERRRKAFAGFQVDAAMMSLASQEAIFMHDLPAHRGEEVSAEVMEGEQSAVFDQAENRMHAQKAVLSLVLGGGE
jgi:ornithine carbamoyltransferase